MTTVNNVHTSNGSVHRRKVSTGDKTTKNVEPAPKPSPVIPPPIIKLRKPSGGGGDDDDNDNYEVFNDNETNWKESGVSLIYYRRPVRTFTTLFGVLLALLQPVPPLTIVCALLLTLITVALLVRLLKSGSAVTDRIDHLFTAPIRVNDSVVRAVLGGVHATLDHIQHELMFAEWQRVAKMIAAILAFTYLTIYVKTHILMLTAVIAVFTLPKFYEIYSEPIERYMSMAQTCVSNMINAGRHRVKM